jgi:hypothetical protein
MHTPQNKQNRQGEEEEKQEYDDNSNKTILTQEIGSWSNFEFALRDENRLVFEKMLTECRENQDLIRAANSKDEYFSAESLFTALILQQQKTIKELIAKVSERKERFKKIQV